MSGSLPLRALRKKARSALHTLAGAESREGFMRGLPGLGANLQHSSCTWGEADWGRLCCELAKGEHVNTV